MPPWSLIVMNEYYLDPAPEGCLHCNSNHEPGRILINVENGYIERIFDGAAIVIEIYVSSVGRSHKKTEGKQIGPMNEKKNVNIPTEDIFLHFSLVPCTLNRSQ